MSKLKDLVFVEDSATLIPDVQISFFYDEKNSKLVKSYVHGRHDVKSGNSATSLSIINEIITNDLSRKVSASRFLIISDYGCGKSHLGLMLSNFFSLKSEDNLMQIFLENVQRYSGNDFKEYIENYKKSNKPKLPILLSGESIEDLKTEIQKSLKRSLFWYKENYDNSIEIESKGSTDTAYNYFMNFKATDKEHLINQYLETNHKIDFTKMMQELENGNNDYLNYAKACAEHVFSLSHNFGDKSLEDILQNIIDNYCTGDNRLFSGLIIIFDEFGQYIDKFKSESPISYKLGQYQQLTNICGKVGNKIHLIQFIQQSPDTRYAHLSPEHEIRKYMGRIDHQITFSSTLEHIVDRIVIQEHNEKGEKNYNWDEFIKRSEVQDITNNLTQKALNIFNSGNNNYAWSLEELKNVVTLGCYPIHPMSVYLLCHSLTKIYQGNRSLIRFLKNKLVPFLENDAVNKNTNEIEIYYPSQLINDIKEYIESIPRDYENASSVSSTYQELKTAIADIRYSNEQVNEKKHILNAIFLSKTFFSEWKELNYFKNIYELLEWLTGISQDKTKYLCENLEQDRVIASRFGVFEFRNKGNINTIEDKLQVIYDEKNKNYRSIIDGTLENTFKKHISDKVSLKNFFKKFNIECEDFKQYWLPQKISILTPDVINDKYQFERIIGTSEEENIRSSVILIKSKANTSAEFIKNEINNALCKLENQKHKVVICFSSTPFEKLETYLIKRSILNKEPYFNDSKFQEEKNNLVQDLNSKIQEELKAIVNNLEYFVEEGTSQNLSEIEKKDLSTVICKLYERNYNKIAPCTTDKFLKNGCRYPKHFIKDFTQGKINTQELTSDFMTFLDMFMKGKPGSWEVLDRSYSLIAPTNPIVKDAYDIIDKNLKFENIKEIELKNVIHKIKTTLSKPPFGYDQPAFFLLFSVWLGVNSKEIEFRKKGDKFHPKNLTIKPAKFFEDWEKELLYTQIRKIEAPNYTDYVKELEICNEFEKAKELINKFDPVTINDPAYFNKIKILVENLRGEVEPIDKFIEEIDKANKKINENTSILRVLNYLIDLNAINLPEPQIIKNVDLPTLNRQAKTNAISTCEKLIKKELEVLSSNANIREKDNSFSKLKEFVEKIEDDKSIYYNFANNIHNIHENISSYKNEKHKRKIDERICQPCSEIIKKNKPIIDAEEFIFELTNNDEYKEYDNYTNEVIVELNSYISNKKNNFDDLKRKFDLINSIEELHKLKQECQSLMIDFGRSTLSKDVNDFQNKIEEISTNTEKYKTLINASQDFQDLNRISEEINNKELPQNINLLLKKIEQNKLSEIRSNIKSQLAQISTEVESIADIDVVQKLKLKLSKIKDKVNSDNMLVQEISQQIDSFDRKLTEFESQNKTEQILYYFKELPLETQKNLINQLTQILGG